MVRGRCPANCTVTASPGAAVPQMGTGLARCSTMLCPSTRGSTTVA
ncbi:hypothetical protein ACFQT0_10085 [Hymenobacter humi]|uniref:Uncharacterized protein n=1 Tax=Hymenobacter humi TaxID=1411620 RepID=A0ABW2U486_9BACT